MKINWRERFAEVKDHCDFFAALFLGGPHAVTVVGQKYNDEKKTCEFKIRNSWGKDCDLYAEDLKCEKDGHIWFSEAKFYQLVEVVEWLEAPSQNEN